MSFAVTPAGPPRIRIVILAGHVHIQGEQRADILVLEGAKSEQDLRAGDDGALLFKAHLRSTHIVLRVPLEAEIVIGTVTGSVSVEGTVDTVRATTKSGAIAIERARMVDARTVTGSIRIQSCGRARLKGAGGRILVGRAARVEAAAIAGSIQIDEVEQQAMVRSVSGRVQVHSSSGAAIGAETVSGRVIVTVPVGARPEVRLRSATGKVVAQPVPGSEGLIRARSISGNIRIIER